jgi:hypothetical protein
MNDDAMNDDATILVTLRAFWQYPIYAKVKLDQSGLGSGHAITTHNWHHNRHHTHGRCWQIWPPSAPHEGWHSAPMHPMDGRQPPEQANIILGGVEGVYGPQNTPML